MAAPLFQVNVDFILLAESGLLVVAAIGVAMLGRDDVSWRWLALFLLAHAGIDWLAIGALGAHTSQALQVAHFGLQTGALIALYEFARRHRFFLHAPAPRWCYAGGAAAIAAITALAGVAILSLLIPLAAGIGGAWGSFWLFRRAQVSAADQARRLRLVALVLPVFALVAALPPHQQHWLDLAGHGELGPIVLKLGLVAILTIPLYACFATEEQARLPAPAARAWRRRRYVGAAIMVALFAGGAIVADKVAAAKDASMREEVLLRTKLGAASLDVELVRTLKWNASDLTNPGYAALKAEISSMRSANRDLRFAMLMGYDQTEVRFLVDSEPPESPDYSPPGQLYDEVDPAYQAAVVERRPFVLGPITDRWGTWVTGSVPLLALGDGRGISFDLDVSADLWAAQLRRVRAPVTIIVLLISLLVLGSFEAQERLRESAQRFKTARDTAEAATRAKSDFLAMMSHELRTPLAGVIGVLDLLRNHPPAELQAQYTAVARDSAETLLHILDDILDTAKIEAGKLRIEAVPFRPREEFRHLCEAARLRAEAKGLELKYTFGGAMPDVLIGDPVRLRQVLANLQNNALKFTESGGVYVTVTCPEVRADSVVLLIMVRDTGCGIDEATRARLFRKFEQADVSTTRRYGGTGLGLSIVKALAESMNGSISVDSEPGRGATFTFVVPLPRPAQGTAVPDTAAPAEISRSKVRLRVLCAEDDRANRIVATELLKQLGHTATFAENGAEALDLLRRQPFDFVLMDGRMPVLDGLSATRMLRDPANGALDPQVYVCAASANASAVSRRQFLEQGMDDYITKPVSRASLAAALDRAIERLRQRGVPLEENTPAPAAAAPAGMSEAELLQVLEQTPVSAAASPALPPAAMQQLLTIFHEDAPKRLAALRAGFARGDVQALADVAHALKSAARYVDAVRLSELAAALEAQATTAERHALQQMLAQIESEYEQLCAARTPPKPTGIST